MSAMKTLRHSEADLFEQGLALMRQGDSIRVIVEGEDALALRTRLGDDGTLPGVTSMLEVALLRPLTLLSMRAGSFHYVAAARADAGDSVEVCFRPREARLAVPRTIPTAVSGCDLEVFFEAARASLATYPSLGDDSGLGSSCHLDLVLDEDGLPDDGVSQNVRTFASLGVDGVHYALVGIDGAIRSESPVLEVSPCDPEPFALLAPDLKHFLAWGCDTEADAIARLFDAERRGEAVLMSFLHRNFRALNLLNSARRDALGPQLAALLPTVTVEGVP